VRRSGALDCLPQLLLDVEMLGRVLLHDVGDGDGGGGGGLKRQRGRFLFERRDREAQFLERRSDLAQARVDAVMNVWERIRDRHLQPMCEEERSPRDPNDAPADDGRIPELVLSLRVVRHGRSLLDRIHFFVPRMAARSCLKSLATSRGPMTIGASLPLVRRRFADS
jgi:hypothetical protein